jgi:hypothetical protein
MPANRKIHTLRPGLSAATSRLYAQATALRMCRSVGVSVDGILPRPLWRTTATQPSAHATSGAREQSGTGSARRYKRPYKRKPAKPQRLSRFRSWLRPTHKRAWSRVGLHSL